MKKFLINILLFSTILLAYFGACALANNYISNNQTSSKLKEDKRILITGDSHTRRGVNPRLFDSAQNISQSGEATYISYIKLKYVLSKMKIDTLLIGYGHHNVSGYNDKKLYDSRWASELFHRCYMFPKDLLAIQDVQFDYFEFAKIYFKNMCLYPNRKHLNFIGGFSTNRGNNLRTSKRAANRHYNENPKGFESSKSCIAYMDSIIQLCERNEVVPIVVGTPVINDYFKRIPRINRKIYRQEMAKLRRRGITVLDFTHDEYPDNYFKDSDHLNKRGANGFTKDLLFAIKNGKAPLQKEKMTVE